MTATAQGLQVGSRIVVAVSIAVIHDAGGAQDTAPQAFAAERFITQHLST